MPALICGSIAYDTIMLFEDRFKNHILPDQVHILNVAFVVPTLRREFGGCAGNIAYNLSLLGIAAEPMGTVGTDFGPYARWMDQCGISRQHITEVDNTFTAQAFITTDLDDNQITAFHPGAMDHSHLNHVNEVEGIRLGAVSPDGRQGMIEHARQFAEEGTPFIFDPGQQLPLFDGDELLTFVDQATWVTLNDYESRLMQERTGKTIEELAERVAGIVVTRGGEGSRVFTGGRCLEVPIAPAREVQDPTGCGDAYRAGLIHGLLNDFDWETTGRVAALMGAIKIEHPGTQNHRPQPGEIDERFAESFGYRL
jgi:adenosine kinase